ncbi:MAG: 30S ribosomal protein S2 [candidate division Zixibacteria bacterium RBG_16_53_22]|nr:MAG: 30S ribosomal protein S2 [candidate division Zixibacteria bacterium RBG_16_53_22]
MSEVTVKDLLESGVHFGHQTRRWNPKMKRFIFTAKNGIYIIDLNKTLMSLNRACQKVAEVIDSGGSILFVGTKKQAKDVIKTNALKAGQFYITERWLGGMLTNFVTIKKNIKRLKEIERMREDGSFGKMTKKEAKKLEIEAARMEKYLVGIREMYSLPSLLFVIDTKKERIAVAEANKLKIPVIGILDTNSDPDPIDYPIAANDDAIKSISIITKAICDTAVQAQAKVRVEEMEEAGADQSAEHSAGEV